MPAIRVVGINLTRFVLLGILLTLGNAAAQGQCKTSCESTTCPRDVWFIDTHCLDDCECDVTKAHFFRLGENGQWIQESQEVFLQTQTVERPVNFYLPGYMSSSKVVVEHGWSLQKVLEKQAKCHGLECPEVRLVFWSWPSEVNGLGLVRDAREKGARADYEGFWLAQLIAKFPKEGRVNLIGYSFGARIAASAADNLAGGYCGNCPFDPKGATQRLTGVLIASAVDADWLASRQPLGKALDRFEKLLLINNCNDRVLKRFRLLDRSERPEALGAVGLLMPHLSAAAHVEQWEVSQMVGRTHSWYRYLETPEISAAIGRFAFFLH